MPCGLRPRFLALLLLLVPFRVAHADSCDEVDRNTGFEFLTACAKLGSAEAQNRLGINFLTGNGVPVDYDKAIRFYFAAAEQGHMRAQNSMGYMVENGQGTQRNYEIALLWYQKSAEQGYDKAQKNIADLLYDHKAELDSDPYKNVLVAIDLYEKAAAQGHSGAMYRLGVAHDLGKYRSRYGIDQDYTEARRWFSEAAEQGHSGGQYWLGVYARLGRTVDQDYRVAADWYAKAGEQGHQLAQVGLGDLLLEGGHGLSPNPTEAMEWFSRAAAQKHRGGFLGLARGYEFGTGVPKDHTKAWAYYKLAEEYGWPGTVDHLETSLEQRDEGRRIIEQWKADHS